MGIINKTHYTYRDLTIVPCVLSNIEHRSECNPFYENEKLPLFTAPMDTVVGLGNFFLYEKHGITPILPRTESLENRINYACDGKWAAFSLQEFEEEFTKGKYASTDNIKALIDIANGHISKLYELVRTSKKIYGDEITVMVGNIANPETYRACVESKVNFVRVGVGGGLGCLSSSNLGVHYPMASLISEVKKIKDEFIERGADENKITKIIADGGIRNYSDIIKALALGADYVMVGSVFARMLESSAVKVGSKFITNRKNIYIKVPLERYENFRYEKGNWYGDYTDDFVKEMKERGHDVEKNNKLIGELNAEFYGMASKRGQIAMKGKKVHTSEGVEKTLPVTYTMSGWVENFTDYLRSAMSYTGSSNLEDFKNKTTLIVNSENAINVVNK